MTDLLNKEHFDALVGRLDTLMEEAAALNAEIAAAMRGEQEHPFWPDRRRSRQHYQPDRRQTSARAFTLSRFPSAVQPVRSSRQSHTRTDH